MLPPTVLISVGFAMVIRHCLEILIGNTSNIHVLEVWEGVAIRGGKRSDRILGLFCLYTRSLSRVVHLGSRVSAAKVNHILHPR